MAEPYNPAASARAEWARRERDTEIRHACEESLSTFLRHAWRHFESGPFQSNWHIDAVAEHLEAVSLGEIDKLVINIPPRSLKTGLAVICWPAWTWARPYNPHFPRMGAQVRFLCASYGARKAQQDGVTARRLIGSSWYQRYWGDRVQIQGDRDNAEQYDTVAGGSRISTGIAESLGKGGLIRLLDDPNKTDEAEGGPVLESVTRAYDEVWSTRSNDPVHGAEVLIMQRLAENDMTGHVIEKGGWTHLCIPAEYEAERHCVTVLGLPSDRYEWHDPRGCDEDGEPLEPEERKEHNGDSFWPSRLRAERTREGDPVAPEDQATEWCRQKAEEIGTHGWAAQFQQRPVARGGNVIQAEWWRLWDRDFPKLGTVVASFDGASGLKRINDYSACTVWGAFAGPRGRPCLLLLDAWRMRGTLNEVVRRLIATCLDERTMRLPEIEDWSERAAVVEWHPNDVGDKLVRGLTERHTKPTAVPRWEVDYLLVENKGPGMPVAQEILRMMGSRRWNTVLVDPEGIDKMARLQRAEHLFENGTIWAPDTTWAQMVIDEVSSFPKAKHDDLTDTCSMAVNWVRKNGVVLTREDHDAEEEDALLFRPEPEPLYDV